MVKNLIPHSVSHVAIIDSAPTPLIMANTIGRIVLVNAEVESLFGYSKKELHGLTIEDLIPERFRGGHAEHRARFVKKSSKRGMSSRADLCARKKDGTEFPVEVRLNPIPTDEEPFVVAAVIDLTERRRHEDELRRSNAALEKSNRELQQLARIASHDLQTPLRGIAGFAQLLQSDYEGKLSPEADAHINRIVGGTKRMQELIEDFLTYTSVTTRARPFAPTDLNAVLDSALARLQSVIADADAKVTREELPVIDCDPAQMAELLQNLIANGIKYRGDTRPKIHVSAKQSGDEWLIAVSDNGIGIAPQHYEKVFEVFRRLHTTAKYPGTGIGLAICRRIVDRHGGRIWVESAAKQGSTFCFTMPLRQSEAA
jgi:PAS domain S-box-containing protein